jgi:O-antigen ligase
MLISGGRSGQAGFFVLIALLLFQRLARRPIVAIITAFAVTTGIFLAGYTASNLFRQRVQYAVHETMNYESAVNSSVGLRINFAINTLRMISKAPLLGVGVGDFPEEYKKVNTKYTPHWKPTTNPHDQFLFVLSTTGIVGGVILLAVLYWPLHFFRFLRDEWSRVRIALPLLFTVICLGESYLWRSNTGLMFVLFTAALYSDIKSDEFDIVRI